MPDEKVTMRFAIEGHDLPGRSCGPGPDGRPYDDVHVGLARRTETVDLFQGDAQRVQWSFDVVVRRDEDGSLYFTGPFVHGRRGERSLSLRWVTLTEVDELDVFRAAKLRLSDLDEQIVEEALARGGRLVARLGLTDDCGYPRCASVRPPDVVWSVEG
jgi:hypothetical protein